MQTLGSLVLVPTPIGNLGDITQRALSVLAEADCILAEDTRTTGILLKHLNISNKLISYHQHNEHQRLKGYVQLIASNKLTALVSDAGTPGLSDPGFLLIRACVEAGLPVSCLPGANALLPALAISGLPMDRFVFDGFLPLKKGRQTRLASLAKYDRTVVIYESPHRLLKTLEQALPFFGKDRPVAVIREISKVYEEAVRGTLQTVIEHFTINQPKGEFVIIIGGTNEN